MKNKENKTKRTDSESKMSAQQVNDIDNYVQLNYVKYTD